MIAKRMITATSITTDDHSWDSFLKRDLVFMSFYLDLDPTAAIFSGRMSKGEYVRPDDRLDRDIDH